MAEIFIIIPAIIGGLCGFGFLMDAFDPNKQDERGLELSQAIFHINTTNLRGRDVQKLQGLQVDLLSRDTALFSNGDFNVEGNVTLHPHSESNKGLVSGDLSFQIPGLDTRTEGKFIIVNETAADDDTKADFMKVHTSLQDPQPVAAREAIARLAHVL